MFPGDKSHYCLADLGCLEGGYTVEFARMGFNVLGFEIRESNIAACRHVKSRVHLPNLNFVQDNVWNIAKYGNFDAVFCSGLLYHMDSPRKFLETISGVTNKLLILHTHFSVDTTGFMDKMPRFIMRLLVDFEKIKPTSTIKYDLSPISENEQLRGRWYSEFTNDESFKNREMAKWSAWDNKSSFWVQKEYLLQLIQDVGFDIVLEQYDNLCDPNIALSMLQGYYKRECRGTFIGIKT
jgi:hypothetical protein